MYPCIYCKLFFTRWSVLFEAGRTGFKSDLSDSFGQADSFPAILSSVKWKQYGSARRVVVKLSECIAFSP